MILNTSDKFVVRKSILELAKTGKPRLSSIDYEIRHGHKEDSESGNLWDYVTVLGAQLSRPPYDPYRETISLDTSLGRRTNKIVLKIPMIIYGNVEIQQDSLESIHLALNRLADNETMLGLVSEKGKRNRNYPFFQKIGKYGSFDSEGLVLEYKDTDSLRVLENIRREFSGPILVKVDDEGFSGYVAQLLDAGADGLFVDTKIITAGRRYEGKHAMAVIRDARSAIDNYYKGKVNDGAVLVVAGDVNSTGNIIKAVALGADVIGHTTSLLIANAEMYSEKPYDAKVVAERIYKHVMATQEELKGVAAAIGYSYFHNLSSSDLRTSNMKASLEGNIPLEGVDKTYEKIVEELFYYYLKKEGIEMGEAEREQAIKSIEER
jgi:hypothetical protein